MTDFQIINDMMMNEIKLPIFVNFTIEFSIS